jgi:hypothetical protein
LHPHLTIPPCGSPFAAGIGLHGSPFRHLKDAQRQLGKAAQEAARTRTKYAFHLLTLELVRWTDARALLKESAILYQQRNRHSDVIHGPRSKCIFERPDQIGFDELWPASFVSML